MKEEIIENSNVLAVINEANVATYFKPNALDPIIEKIRAEVKAFKPDISTDKGRKQISSMARKVASAKIWLDDQGKELVAGLKQQSGLIDAERKRMRDILDTLKEETRKPLTDWEEREEKRTGIHKDALDFISGLLQFPVDVTMSELDKRLLALAPYEIRDFEEFSELAKTAISNARTTLTERIVLVKKAETDRKELERLQQAEKDRQQEERDKKLQDEAAERARNEASEEIRQANEREKRAEEERKNAEKKAEGDRIEAAKQAEIDKDKAVKEERERNEKIKRDEEAAAAAREADTKHKKKINNEAKDALMKMKIAESTAMDIIKAIALGNIPNIKIIY